MKITTVLEPSDHERHYCAATYNSFWDEARKKDAFYDEKQLFWNQANENGRIHNMQQTLFGTNRQTRGFSVGKPETPREITGSVRLSKRKLQRKYGNSVGNSRKCAITKSVTP